MGIKGRRVVPSTTDGLTEAVTVTHGDHLFALYAADADRVALGAAFLLDGLREGSVCFLIGPDSSRRGIVAALKKKEPRIAEDIAAGRLIGSEHQNSPRAQYEFFERHTSAAEQRGARSFRLFADMIGARRRMSLRQVLKLEGGFDDMIVRKHQIAAMCAYDVRRFSGTDLLGALKTHRGPVRYASDDTRKKAVK
jgi:hypothetical protein